MRECNFKLFQITIMKKCAVLTMDNLENFGSYDHLLIQPMKNLNWHVDFISWRKENIDWDMYLSVIIRSPWDYQDDPQAFLQVLSDIENSSARLLNSLNIVKWNINKKYLQELEEKGIEIVPTYWLENFNYQLIQDYFLMFNTNQIVIKPTISANADNTFWLKKESYNSDKSLLEKCLTNKQLMVQPFIPAVVEEGEYSLFYFADQYSHCILKTPKSGDFRVQEEHGSSIKAVEPSQKLLDAGFAAVKAIPEKVLYARVDLVEFMGSYKVMEVELIEPSLYFNYDELSPERFAMAFDKWMK